MFIWVGIDIDDQLLEIKKFAYEIERELNFKIHNLTLPLHISLKMSFEVEDSSASDIISFISDYYSKLNSFDIQVNGIENENVICWIAMNRNPQLDKIHDDLNVLLGERYNIGLHEYDLDYRFHVTLFMDENELLINSAYEKIKNIIVPNTLRAKKFVIGKSSSGGFGTYTIVKTVEVV